jgi:hypothetical protein
MASTHLESDRMDGTRLVSILSAEDSTNAACCRPVTVFAAVLVTPGWSLAFPPPCFLRLSDRVLANYALQLECLIVCQNACPLAAAVTRTIFPLNVSQQLRDAPFQNYHLNCRDAFGSQPTIYALQHLLLFVGGDKDPSGPFVVCFGELLCLVLCDELVRLARSLPAWTLGDSHKTGPTALCYGLPQLGPRSQSHLSGYSSFREPHRRIATIERI